MPPEYTFWLDGSNGGRFSYRGTGATIIEGLDRLAEALATHHREPDPTLPFPFQGGWVGYITYEGRAVFIRVDQFEAIDHQTGQTFTNALNPPPEGQTGTFQFARSKEEYLANIAECLRAIRAGESYELCLTTQLRAQTSAQPLAYFQTLRQLNPAPYAAFIQTPDVQIACSSPELFLNVTAEGHVTSKPIKGTAPRSQDPAELASDEKSRAENLMIVDLVRNDLGRVCRTGTVKVTKLRDIETYATVHHMVSTIEGDLKPGLTAIDAILAAFPPGSMTGAPKIRTMEILQRLEQQPRGIYAGCIGFLSFTGAATFNVAIRAAVFSSGEVTIGTGGAIVAQSDPEREWDELNLKAEILLKAFKMMSEACSPTENR
jgi:para-aminobenzoate synthetase